MDAATINRRALLLAASTNVVRLAIGGRILAQESSKAAPTRFQIACMTLPYGQYPLVRALSGIKSAGYQYVAWGTTLKEPGESKGVPVMPADAPPAKAKELGQQ